VNKLIDLRVSDCPTSGPCLYAILFLKQLFLSFLKLFNYLLLPVLHNLLDLVINLGLVVLNVELSDNIDGWAILHYRSKVLDSRGGGLILIPRVLVILMRSAS